MNILLTNDDGIHFEGLWAIYQQFSEHHKMNFKKVLSVCTFTMAQITKYGTECQNCLYYFCLQTYQKTIGTNEKVASQGIILTNKKNTFLIFTPSKVRKITFLVLFGGFFKHV